MSKRKEESDYKVGYGKPPKHTQFKSGQSGNPRGRPKGRKNLGTILEEVYYEKVQISRNGRKTTVPAIKALLLRAMQRGMEGDNSNVSIVLKYLPMLMAHEQSRGGAYEADASSQMVPIEDTERQLLEAFSYLLKDGALIDTPSDEDA